MGKHTFKTALNFEQVEAGSAEDNVLVRTAEGDVKEVARGEFSSGGIQDLQSVLDNGPTASFDEGTSSIDLLSGDSDNRYFGVNLNGQQSEGSINIDITSFQMKKINEGNLAEISLDNGELTLARVIGEFSEDRKYTVIRILEPIGETLLSFPSKTTGDYILATTDDLPANQNLQSVLEEGNVSTTPMVIGMEGGDGDDEVIGTTIEPDTVATRDNGDGAYTQMTPQGIWVKQKVVDNIENTQLTSDKLMYNEAGGGKANNLILKRTGEGEVNYKFNDANIGGMTYTLATLDDIKIGTTAPTSTSDIGEAKEIRVADGYIYWYVVGTGWLRSAGATF